MTPIYFCTITIASHQIVQQQKLRITSGITSNNKSDGLTRMLTFPSETFVPLQLSLPPSLGMMTRPCLTFVPDTKPSRDRRAGNEGNTQTQGYAATTHVTIKLSM